MSEAFRGGASPASMGAALGPWGASSPQGTSLPLSEAALLSPFQSSISESWHLLPEDTASPLCYWKGFQALQGEAPQRSFTFSGMDRVQTRWSSEK